MHHSQQPTSGLPPGRTSSVENPSTIVSQQLSSEPSSSHRRPPLHSAGRHSMFTSQISQTPSQTQRPEYNRENSLLRQLSTFVGINEDEEERSIWEQRAERRIQKKYPCKDKHITKSRLSHTRSYDVNRGITTSTRHVAFSPTVSLRGEPSQIANSSGDTRQPLDTQSTLATKDIHQDVPPYEKENALKLVWNSLSNVITKGTSITHKRRPIPLRSCKSFDIEQIEPDSVGAPKSAAATPHVLTSSRSPFFPQPRRSSGSHPEQFEMSALDVDFHSKLSPLSAIEESDNEPASQKASEKKGEDLGLALHMKTGVEAQDTSSLDLELQCGPWMMVKGEENEEETKEKAETTRPSNLRLSGRPLSKKTSEKLKVESKKQVVKFYDSECPEHVVELESNEPFMKTEEDDLVNERFFDMSRRKQSTSYMLKDRVEDETEKYVEAERRVEDDEPSERAPVKAKSRVVRARFTLEPTYMLESLLPQVPVPLAPPADRTKTNGVPDRPHIVDGVPRRPPLEKQRSIEESKYNLEIFMDLARDFVMKDDQPRMRGISKFGQLCGLKLRKKKIRRLKPEVRQQIEEGEDERPFFTWWVTTVQVVVCLVSIVAYGFGPVGFSREEMKKEVQDVTLSYRQVSYHEPNNFWFGPKFADLIRLGAKYSPCMRKEQKLWDVINSEREAENRTGCCVFNDNSGCYQTGKSSCPLNIATWVKWQKRNSSNIIGSQTNGSSSLQPTHRRDSLSSVTLHRSRTSGAVCGHDPDYCQRPASVMPYEWSDDITEWPQCRIPSTGQFLPKHMTCRLSGRPCCIQLQGLCRITSKEYCNFVNGYWHENATLCAQVDCFSDVCGMLPFFKRGSPNQLYRLFISLFVHAGLFHLAITVAVQLWLMRDLEKFIGWLRMALLYVGSGVGGNLASAIFVPFNPEVGPSGSQLGILAALLVEIVQYRSIIDYPWHAIGWQLLIVLLLFLVGLIPWVDNWAHLFGFIFGLLIAIATFPNLDFTPENDKNDNVRSEEEKEKIRRRALWRRRAVVIGAVLVMTLLFLVLSYIFIWNIQVDCPFCEYFNCINIKILTKNDHFCDNSGQALTKWLPI